MKKIILAVLLGVLLISVKAYADTEWPKKFDGNKYVCKVKGENFKIKIQFFYTSLSIEFGDTFGHFDATETEDVYRRVDLDKNFYVLFNRKTNTLVEKALDTKKVIAQFKFVNCVDFNNLD